MTYDDAVTHAILVENTETLWHEFAELRAPRADPLTDEQMKRCNELHREITKNLDQVRNVLAIEAFGESVR
jgi:hypothetical protein